MNLQEIAKKAGVSIATVSHVLNHTRYVSPSLQQKVEAIIKECGYQRKSKEHNLIPGANSQILLLVPNLKNTFYILFFTELHATLVKKGYQLLLSISNNDTELEKQMILNALSSKKTLGLIVAPCSMDDKNFITLIKSNTPFVLLENNCSSNFCHKILSDYSNAIPQATSALLEKGHRNILLLVNQTPSSTTENVIHYYQKELNDFDTSLVPHIVKISLTEPEESIFSQIRKELSPSVTAIIACDNPITSLLMKALHLFEISCPKDISVIGWDDQNTSDALSSDLAHIKRNTAQLAKTSFETLLHLHEGKKVENFQYINVDFRPNNSIRILHQGPRGENPTSLDRIRISQSEKVQLVTGKYRVAISFHYTGTAWAKLHQKGIRDELEKYGIEIISIMDAHFDPMLQKIQLESIQLQNPDAVIAIPVDDIETSSAFEELSKHTRVILLSNIPKGFNKNNYVSCISVDEHENGYNIGHMIGDYLENKTIKNTALITHGANFYGTSERDSTVLKTLLTYYPSVNVVAQKNFYSIENTYSICSDLINAHPEISSLYVSWDQPALLAIKALDKLNRKDIAVFTTDLDYEIAEKMKEGIVKGISTQRPYEQGQAAGRVLAKSLVSEDIPKYIAVQPYLIKDNQLKQAWQNIFFEKLPMELE